MRSAAPPSTASISPAVGCCCCAIPGCSAYTFNPLSVYFCYRAGGELALVIYEVRNTFGDIHAYVLPVSRASSVTSGLRQQQEKLFYVSPFIDDGDALSFSRLCRRATRVKLRILETDRDGPLLAATFNGRRRALTTAQLLRSFFALPLVTLKIVAAIHWEALRLWLKGARLVPARHNASCPQFRLGERQQQPLYLRRCCLPAGTLVSEAGSGSTDRHAPGKEPSFDGFAMPELISVTPDNVDAVLPDLPRMVRLALGFGSKLRRGTLDVTLPDGRTVRLGGNGAGPGGRDEALQFRLCVAAGSTAAISALRKPICAANGTRRT